ARQLHLMVLLRRSYRLYYNAASGVRDCHCERSEAISIDLWISLATCGKVLSPSEFVIPVVAKRRAGIHNQLSYLDSRLRGNDGLSWCRRFVRPLGRCSASCYSRTKIAFSPCLSSGRAKRGPVGASQCQQHSRRKPMS